MRRIFYACIGLTFPIFWTMHAGGFLGFLYLPIQTISGSKSTGWPSFISAACLYLACILAFELLSGNRVGEQSSSDSPFPDNM